MDHLRMTPGGCTFGEEMSVDVDAARGNGSLQNDLHNRVQTYRLLDHRMNVS